MLLPLRLIRRTVSHLFAPGFHFCGTPQPSISFAYNKKPGNRAFSSWRPVVRRLCPRRTLSWQPCRRCGAETPKRRRLRWTTSPSSRNQLVSEISSGPVSTALLSCEDCLICYSILLLLNFNPFYNLSLSFFLALPAPLPATFPATFLYILNLIRALLTTGNNRQMLGLPPSPSSSPPPKPTRSSLPQPP